MKYAVRYFSRFGHSEQMAQVAGEVLGVKPESIDVPIDEDTDILFFGAGLFLGRVNGRIKAFASSLFPKRLKKVVCFGSCALLESPVPQLRKIFEDLHITVAEESFSCRGAMGPLHSGHPDEKDLNDFRAFVEKVK